MAVCIYGMVVRYQKVSATARDKGDVRGQQAPLWEGQKEVNYFDLILLLYAIIFLLLVGGLAIYHTFLVTGNLTTHEEMKRLYYNSNGESISPFDQGMVGNIKAVCCVPKGPSAVLSLARRGCDYRAGETPESDGPPPLTEMQARDMWKADYERKAEEEERHQRNGEMSSSPQQQPSPRRINFPINHRSEEGQDFSPALEIPEQDEGAQHTAVSFHPKTSLLAGETSSVGNGSTSGVSTERLNYTSPEERIGARHEA